MSLAAVSPVIPPSPAVPVSCSRRLMQRLASPSAAEAMTSMASPVILAGERALNSGEEVILSSMDTRSSTESGLSTCTEQRLRRGAFTWKEGFSVVAPTRRMVPFSTWGRKASCCDRLNLCISSTKSIVPCR